MRKLTFETKITLNNGVRISILGLGTFEMGIGRETQNAVLWALEAGYRLIDTAAIYGNEKAVGKAIKLSGIPREEIFITTKVWNSDQGYRSTIKACEKSLEKLDTSYIDLYLIHWPVERLRIETWRALETLLEDGRCRAIGVSNYMIWHIEELLNHASTIPAINQVEFSPYLYQKALLEFCHSHRIQIEAYSPLTKGVMLNDQKLLSIASRYSKTPAQILIRWALQRNLVVIPKSANKNRIYENSKVIDFEISSEDMKLLDSFNENLRTGWDPSNIP
ncbi:MAG: aldo/keto reductase [Candidatus Helarchaeota archaeon]